MGDVKAILYEAFGGADVLEHVDVPDPEPGPLDVVVAGRRRPRSTTSTSCSATGGTTLPGFTLPHIAGMDIAGTVVAVGDEVDARRRWATGSSSTRRWPAAPTGSQAGRDRRPLRRARRHRRHRRRRLRRAVPRAGDPRAPGARLDVVEHDRRGVPDGLAHRLARAVRRRPPRPGETVLIHAAGSGVSHGRHPARPPRRRDGARHRRHGREVRAGARARRRTHVANNRDRRRRRLGPRGHRRRAASTWCSTTSARRCGRRRCSRCAAAGGSSTAATRPATRRRSRRSATCSTSGISIIGSDPYRPHEFAEAWAAVLHDGGFAAVDRQRVRRSPTRPRRSRSCCATTSSARSCSAVAPTVMADSPYPELKKTHTMAHTGRPWRDHKPPPPRRCGRSSRASAPTGCWWRRSSSACSTRSARPGRPPADAPSPPSSAPSGAAPRPPARRARRHRVPRPASAAVLRAHRDRRALPVPRRGGVDGRAGGRRARPARQLDRRSPTRSARACRRRRSRTTPPRSTRPLVTATFPTQLPRRHPPRRACIGSATPPGAAGARPRRRRGRRGRSPCCRQSDGLDGGRQRPARRDRAGGRGRLAVPRRRRPRRAARRRLPRHRRSSDGAYDVVVLGHVLPDRGRRRAPRAARRAVDALAPGGQLVARRLLRRQRPQRTTRSACRWALTMLASHRGAAARSPTPQVARLVARRPGFGPIRLLEPIGVQPGVRRRADPPSRDRRESRADANASEPIALPEPVDLLVDGLVRRDDEPDARRHPRRRGRRARRRDRRRRQGGRPRPRYAPGAHDRRRPLRRHAGHGQHPHPHHRRAADPRLRPRRHAVRGERVRVAVPAVRRLRRRPRSARRRSWPRSRCCARARRRSSRRARSASSTTSSTASSRSASAAGSGAGCGTSRPSPTVYRQTTDEAIAHLERQLDRPPVGRRRPRVGRGRSSSATRRAATRCGGRPARSPTSTASA